MLTSNERRANRQKCARANRQKCAHVLTDLVAATVLPRHTRGFALQLLDLAHTWSVRDDNDIDLNDILALAAAVYMFIENGSRVGPSATISSHTSRHPDLLTAGPNVAISEDISASHTREVPHVGCRRVRAGNPYTLSMGAITSHFSSEISSKFAVYIR